MKSHGTSTKARGRLVWIFAGLTSRCQQFNLLRLINQAKIQTRQNASISALMHVPVKMRLRG